MILRWALFETAARARLGLLWAFAHVNRVPTPVVMYACSHVIMMGVMTKSPTIFPTFSATECNADNSPLRFPLRWPKYIEFRKEPWVRVRGCLLPLASAESADACTHTSETPKLFEDTD